MFLEWRWEDKFSALNCSKHFPCLMFLNLAKDKGKVVPVLKQAPPHEGVLRSGGIAPRIL
jgi:hypothetical protein